MDEQIKYQKEEKVLGKGAFGIVNLGTKIYNKNQKVEKIVLKEIPTALDKDQEKSLSKEVNISLTLDNTNIVKMFDIIELNNTKYLAYELCNGKDLKRYMKYFKKFDENLIQIITIKMINGLKELHKKKLFATILNQKIF